MPLVMEICWWSGHSSCIPMGGWIEPL